MQVLPSPGSAWTTAGFTKTSTVTRRAGSTSPLHLIDWLDIKQNSRKGGSPDLASQKDDFQMTGTFWHPKRWLGTVRSFLSGRVHALCRPGQCQDRGSEVVLCAGLLFCCVCCARLELLEFSVIFVNGFGTCSSPDLVNSSFVLFAFWVTHLQWYPH